MREFIRKNGVTKCPATRTRELALLHIQREREIASMTPKERQRLEQERVMKARGRRKKILTPEEKEARRLKLNAYQRERAAKKRREKEANFAEA